MFWDGKRCGLCRRRCVIPEGAAGVCGVRKNINGTLYTINYGKVVALGDDPIEKKPLFHVLPGSRALSYALFGCNFKCLYCQNYEISQEWKNTKLDTIDEMTPSQLLSKSDAPIVAHTYGEPTIFFEYALEVSKLAHEQGRLNAFVTNGYITPEALDTIRPYLDAANIDLKAFNERFYRELCGGIQLDEVLDSIQNYYRKGIHIELTTLVIPGWNDDREEFESMVQWIHTHLSPDVPLHITAFHPDYKMKDASPTPLSTLYQLWEVARQHLHYVYIGNAPAKDAFNTYCPKCGRLLIERDYMHTRFSHVTSDGKCPYCGHPIRGIWKTSL